jgi:sulfite exporter TauE/SafE/copper chaperone CopZ
MKKSFKIKGMHCNSCSTLIENELKGKVKNISVSYANEKAEIEFDENKISEKEIKEAIKKIGYNVEETNIENKSKKNKTGWIVVSVSIILFLAVIYFLFLRNLDLSSIKIPELGEKTSLILLFAAGLLTGFHCISMCGGFVVSYTTKNAVKGYKGFKQHLVYGGSKVISYTIIGGIFGLIGGVFAFSTKLRGAVAILAGIFMVFYAFSIFGVKFFRKFQINPKFLTKLSAKAASKTKGQYKTPFITGLLNGLFIACGPLQAMYLYAMGTGSFLTGAISLTAFGLGTLPVMLGFGSLATMISHKTTRKILKISAIIVLILGLIMLNRGLTLTGGPNFDSIKAKRIGPTSPDNASLIKNGVQEVNMVVDSSGYSPSSFVLKKGIPVKWNVNVKELTGCNQELVLNEYGINKMLKQGLNVIEFTPDKIETIQFSCGMGMLRGSFVVTETGTATQQELTAAAPKSSGGCGCGGMK